MPYAVLRLYTDSGPLVAKIRDAQAEVEAIMREVPGFVMYGLMDTGSGALSLTVCDDKAGTDESTARAAEWIKSNLPDAKIAPPHIIEGERVFTIQHRLEPGQPHATLRIFSEAAPEGMADHEAEIRELMTSTPGFRGYHVVQTDSGGATLVVGDDKACTDEVGRRMREFVQSTFPNFTRTPPQVIEGDGVFRIGGVVDAQATPA